MRKRPTWILELALDGARNLFRHKLRSLLTLLGVMFGVGAVVTMMAIGEGAQRTVLKEIEGLGLNNIIMDSVPATGSSPKSPPPTSNQGLALYHYGLTFRDVLRIQALFPDASVTTAHLVKRNVYQESQRIDTRVLGVTPDYFTLFQTTLVKGRLISEIDNLKGHAVAVVTEPVAGALTGFGEAVGKSVRIGGKYIKIIGVVRLPSRLGSVGIFMPYITARRLYGTTSVKRESGSVELTRTEVGQVVINLTDEKIIMDAAQVVQRMISQTHSSSDVLVTVPLDLLLSKQRTQRVLNMVLLAIAGISLLVGGIGIMNIMLAVVTERIPEIGVRRAIGASQRDILWQFLAETVVLSTTGGLIGCLLGFVAVPVAAQFTGWPGVFTPGAVLTALGVSWLVGVVFGLAPAAQAAKLRPVECLRHG
jgi:putative ABC transport system permease protein